MTSFIVVSTDREKRAAFLTKLYAKENVDAIDVSIVSLDNSVKQNTQSIGIEDIKFMQKKIFLKPLRSGSKAVVLEEAHLLTTEAQNALLKVLEEPPQNTLIILSTESKETLLPTIISRCFVIDLGEENEDLSEKETKDLELFLEALPQWGIGERLKKAEQLAKDKDKAIEWVKKIIIVTREKMLASYSSNNGTMEQPARNASQRDAGGWSKDIKAFQTLHTSLKTTNVNPRFAIENALLNIYNN